MVRHACCCSSVWQCPRMAAFYVLLRAVLAGHLPVRCVTCLLLSGMPGLSADQSVFY
jgi:hypothetical protein